MPLVERSGTRTAGSLLIKGATVLSMDPGIGVRARDDILVRDGVITAIGPALDAVGAQILDATSMIAMPGFVDGHRHLREGVVRNALPDADLGDYFRIIGGAVAPGLQPRGRPPRAARQRAWRARCRDHLRPGLVAYPDHPRAHQRRP
jgi:cytosine/adenosine deaminase-related metal-dependent hydrolase